MGTVAQTRLCSDDCTQRKDINGRGFGPTLPTSSKEQTMTPEEYRAAVYASAVEGAYCLAAMICASAAVWAIAAKVTA